MLQAKKLLNRELPFHSSLIKTSLTGLFYCFCFFSIIAAEVNVTGKVSALDTENPLAGVSIMVEGTSNGTVTDIEGNYAITVQSEDARLVLSYIGFQRQVVPVNGRSVINIKLKMYVKVLNEFVFVGYGNMRKTDLTGAISSINASEITKSKSYNSIEALQAKVAGMDIHSGDGRAGSNPGITLRGARSLSGSNTPLYIVDGVEFGSTININPNDIESIEVLKDVSSTAIYGSKGANGVVLITTKKGQEGQAKVTLNTYYGITQPLGTLPWGDRDYYLRKARDLYRTDNPFEEIDGNTISTWDQSDDYINQKLLSSARLYPEEQVGFKVGTDFIWPKEQLEDYGTQQCYHINIAGGSDKKTYATSIEHFIEDTYFEKDKYERYGFRTFLESDVNRFLKVGNNSILTHEILTRGESLSFNRSPLVKPFDENNDLIPYPIESLPFANPYINMDPDNKFSGQYRTRIFTNFFAELTPMEGLSMRSNINVDLNFRRFGNSVDEYPGLDRVSSARVENTNRYTWTWTNVFTYDKTVCDKHHFIITAATEAMNNRNEFYGMAGTQLELQHQYGNYGNWYNLDKASGDRELYSDFSKISLISYIGRLHYSFMDRYLTTFSVRRDGASQLAAGREFDTFPSIALAWRVSEEGFMKDLSHIVSNLKLRFGYGYSGNQSISPYSSFGGIASYNLYYDFGDTGYIGTRTGRISNKSLGWEKTTGTNIGIDFGFLKNKIAGSIEVYRSETNDILQNKSLPPTSAIASVAANIGSTLNKGIEVTVTTVNVEKRNFKWTTDLTFASNIEEITYLANGVKKDVGNGWFVGYPLVVFYDYEFVGIWQLNEAEEAAIYGAVPGDIKLRDVTNEDMNGNGSIEAEAEIRDDKGNTTIVNEFQINDLDRVIIGTSRPDWYGGITSNMTIFNFDLSILFYARIGQTIQDAVRTSWSPDGRENSFRINYWTPNNPTNNFPRVNPGLTRSGWAKVSTLGYTDGSFYKIKDITLGYTLPQRLTRKLYLSNARIYGSAKNAIVFSKFFDKGRFDPEMEGGLGYPSPKLFLIGASVTF